MAIKARLNPLSNNEVLLTFEKGKKLQEYYDDALKDYPHKKAADQYFKILINGHEVDREFWGYVSPKESCSVLIAMVPKDGQLLRAGITLGAVVAATYFSGGAYLALSPTATAAFVGSVAVGTGLLLNALIPPPKLGNSIAAGAAGRGFQGSQMFAITSQANVINKYGTVPKLYGRHRMFPAIAANPYTSLETDPRTGELAQYFYAVYDFGLGPLDVNDLKIGETSIQGIDGQFDDVQFRLVDPNRPSVPEGIWDEKLKTTFELYKGVVVQQDVSVALNSNQNDPGAAPSTYQSIRNAEPNPSGFGQQVELTMVFPLGLNTFDTQGNSIERNVDLKVEFAEIGTEVWRDFNNLAYVDDFNSDVVRPIATAPERGLTLPLGSWNDDFTDGIQLVSTEDYNWIENQLDLPEGFMFPNGTVPNPYDPLGTPLPVGVGYVRFEIYHYGLKEDKTKRLPFTIRMSDNSFIYKNGKFIGEVLSTETHPGGFWHNITPAGLSENLLYDIRRKTYVNNVDWLNDQNPTSDSFYYKDYLGLGDNIPNSEFLGFTGKQFTAGVGTFVGNQTNAFYGTFKFTPKTAESIKVRITRLRSYGGGTFSITDAMTWLNLNTRFDKDAIKTTKRHTFMEIRIRATDQLNGSIQNLSGVCQSAIDVYDGAVWSKQLTSNPAWVYVDILTGEVNKRAISKSRLDLSSILDWANFCDEVPDVPPNIDVYSNPRFQCNFILDYAATINEVIGQVTNAAQASFNVINGKYGILIDRAQTIPIQMFTPRNSSNFSSRRKYVEIPDALKISFVDSASKWEVKQNIVYDDGKTPSNSEKFEDLDTFGCTNFEQAYRYGRYMLAQAKLRQENITIQVDFENLVCTRGDYVVITQDVMKVGGVPARVVNVSGSDITIDEKFTTLPATNYGYTYRTPDGQIKTDTMTINTPTEATVDGDVPAVGDLIVWGEVDLITFDCIVKAITPASNLAATLTLVEKNDAIYLAESSEVIGEYDPQFSNVQDTDLTPPAAVTNLQVTDNTFDCDGANYIYQIKLSWDIPLGTVFEIFEIYVDKGQGYNLDGFTNELNYTHNVDANFLGNEHKFKVLAVSAAGTKINLGEALEVTETPTIKTTPPSDVASLFINITNQTLTLNWPKVSDCDVLNYQIRYSPNTVASWNNSVPLATIDAQTSSFSTQARTGSYYIKVFDFNENQSINAASVITSIPGLIDLNVIEETNDFPAFPGTLDKVVQLGSSLILAENNPTEFYTDGNYFYADFLDLGDIYTARLQSLIDAEGYTEADIMSSWITLDSVAAMSTTLVSDWDVITYNRRRDSIIVMSNWTTLDTVAKLSTGSEAEWTPWSAFTAGDFTGRIFEFRLELVSNKASVSPRVIDAKIKSDMPDRTVSKNNLTSNAGSVLTILFTPSFKGPTGGPAIAISQDNAQNGDYYKITNKTVDGFDIEFFDTGDTSVARQFDFIAKGFGQKTSTTI